MSIQAKLDALTRANCCLVAPMAEVGELVRALEEREKVLREVLSKVKVAHEDWAGYLVHRSDHRRDPTQQQLEYDEHCPACVMRELRRILEAR